MPRLCFKAFVSKTGRLGKSEVQIPGAARLGDDVRERRGAALRCTAGRFRSTARSSNMMLTRKLMAGAGLVALSAGMAAAAPAVVQSDVNLRAGPGIEYEVIGAMPGGATVNVRRCEASWCRVNFAGTVGYASRAFLGLGATTGPVYGAATGPVYGATTGPAYGAATGPVYGATTGPAYGVTTGPVYGAGYAYSGYAPRYTYEEDTFGYAPGTYGTTTVGVAAGEGREFRGYRRE